MEITYKEQSNALALLAAVVTFAYQIFGIVGYVPPVSENEVVQTVGAICNIAVALGIIVDPTTAGVADSDMAMNYNAPRGGDE